MSTLFCCTLDRVLTAAADLRDHLCEWLKEENQRMIDTDVLFGQRSMSRRSAATGSILQLVANSFLGRAQLHPDRDIDTLRAAGRETGTLYGVNLVL